MADVLPVDEDLTAGDIVEPRDQVAQGGFAAAGRPHQGQAFPGPDAQIHVAQYLVVVVGVLKAHIPEFDAALPHGQRPGVGGIGDGHGSIHDFQEALDAGHAPLELLGKFHDASDGGNQGGNVEHIGHQIAGIDGPVYQRQAAGQNDDQIHQPVEQAGGSVEGSHGVVGKGLDVLKGSVALGKLFPLLGLGGKGLDHPLPQQAVLDGGVEFPDLEALLPETGPQFQVQIDRYHAHQRNAGKHHQRQGDAGLAEDEERGNDLDEGNKKLLGAVMGKFCDIEQIVGDAPHDLPHLGVVVIGVVQPQQVVKSVAAHIGFDMNAHDMPGAGHEITGGAVNEPQHKIQQGQFQNSLYGQGRTLAGGGVGQHAHDLGQHDITQSGQGRAEQVKQQNAFVFHQIGQKTAQQYAAAALLLTGRIHEKILTFYVT